MEEHTLSKSSQVWVGFGIFVSAVFGGWLMHTLDNTDQAIAADPTATVTATAVPATPTPKTGDKGQPPAPSAVCNAADKIGTWSPQKSLNPYIIEVGGGGWQHFDYHPNTGVAAVSYIVGPQKAMKWTGYGSIWEWNGPGCKDNNYVQDAVNYASGDASINRPDRLTQGHSGIVIDLRSGFPVLVANVANLSNDQMLALLLRHAAGMGLTDDINAYIGKLIAAGVKTPANVTIPKITANPTTAGGECKAVRQPDATRPNGANSVVTLGGDGHAYVFELWNPQVENGKEMKILVPADSASRTFTGFGGAIWQYPTTCSAQQVADDFNKNGKPAYTG